MKYIFLLFFMSLMACDINVSGSTKNNEPQKIDITKLSDPEIKKMAEDFFDSNEPAKIAEMYKQLKGTAKEYTFRNNLLEHSKDDLEKFSENLEAMGFNPEEKYSLEIPAQLGDNPQKLNGNYVTILAAKIKNDKNITTPEKKVEEFYKNIKLLEDERNKRGKTGAIAGVFDILQKEFLENKKIDDILAYFDKNVSEEIVAGILSLVASNQADRDKIAKWLVTGLNDDFTKKRRLRIFELANIPITQEFFENNLQHILTTDPDISDKLFTFYNKMDDSEKVKISTSFIVVLVQGKITNATYETAKDLINRYPDDERKTAIKLAISGIERLDRANPGDDPIAKQKLLDFLKAELDKLPK